MELHQYDPDGYLEWPDSQELPEYCPICKKAFTFHIQKNVLSTVRAFCDCDKKNWDNGYWVFQYVPDGYNGEPVGD